MKKVLALAMAAVLSMGALTACGNDDSAKGDAGKEESSATDAGNDTADNSTGAEAISLKVWCPEEEMELTKKMCDSFQAVHPEYDITWDFAVVGVDESVNNITTDADTAADVFQIPSGSVAQLVESGLLLPIGYDIDNVKSLYSEGALEACSKDGLLYGVPSTPNTWFMYYNSSMYTEEEVKSLDTMMAKDLGEDVYNFSCTLSDAWYLEAFFNAAGCNLFGPEGTDPGVCTWNDANGLAAGNYLIELANNPKYIENTDGIATSLFKEGKLGAISSGTWASAEFKNALGDNYAACALPTININGEDKQLINFADYKCFTVKSNTAHPLAAQQLAEWLANEENQLLRYQEVGSTPACVSLQDSPELAEDPATLALLAQTQYSIGQPAIPQINQFWTPGKAFGEGIAKTKEITSANIQEKLDQLVESITTSAIAE